MQTTSTPMQFSVSTPDDNWLSANAFANLAGLKERSGRHILLLAAQGKLWNGYKLNVRRNQCTGGKSGYRYEVLATSLPSELVQKWISARAQQPTIIAPVVQTIGLEDCDTHLDPLLPKRTDEALWRLSVIQPLLAYRRWTPERSAIARTLLKRQHTRPDGSKKKISRATLYEWVTRYEEAGLEGLTPRQRKDTGSPRTLISRAWDKACPLDEEARQAIATQLRDYIRSLWCSGVTGWRAAQQLASSKLAELSRATGWNADAKCCRVTRPMIEAERQYGLVAVCEQDAKRFFDRHLPRIRRSRDGMLPMDVIVGDVHPIDIAVRRPDGSIAYPRAIAWLDVANNRLFFSLALLRKGEGIKQTDIARSFASMCAAWGLPKVLYLDNGSEYSWHEMMTGFQHLARLTRMSVRGLDEDSGLREILEDDGREVIRARPYNAPAKPIEGLFGLLEQRVFAMIPGWVGGNRMKKKTHNVGHEPLPYPGSWEDFQQAMEEALTFYHQTPQQGSLRGFSPQQVFEAALAQGWGRVDVSEQVLLVAFASEGQRQASSGYISWDGTEYYDDALLPHTGRNLTVRVARHDPHYAFVFDGDAFICAAQPAPVYGFLDTEGAKEQARRQKVLMREITGRKSHTNRLDLVDEMTRHNRTQAPMPDAPVQTTVTLSGAVRDMIEATKVAEMKRLESEQEIKTACTNTRRLSQWSTPGERDPYLEAVEFTDE
ncbi:hypothetical protein DSF30_13715 [Salmonella enterica subsp. enterica serovar Oranienburg]|nr:hypothetical protein [Salmonella enterica subsp. enterica serovar Oranienburg]ECD5542854.1 hypothetical protein [Salmonella enterica subsp. enterica serovar Kokomlemle]HAF2283658.1 helix-turn-helix domain-containing protein [Salmonella enterica]EBX4923444.1 hypothetical protein [Salmonella enterica subsp. enterica serovar Oranienburg]EDT5580044.1 helix-turn-helix domain-containing protein [Salmonella enterica subsp. enterica serovar Kokomlemle]